MTSFRIGLTPSRQAAGRAVTKVRRAIQKAFAEERQLTGLTQSGIAQAVGVHRSVISRQLRGREDISLSRVGELAHAMNRNINFSLPRKEGGAKVNWGVEPAPKVLTTNASTEVSGGRGISEDGVVSGWGQKPVSIKNH